MLAMRYHTILFDADNTLFDFSRCEKEAITDVLRMCDITPTCALINGYSDINDNMWKKLERGGISKDALREVRFFEFCNKFDLGANAKQMSALYIDCLSQKKYVFDGVEEICRKLSEQCDLYIITNGIQIVQERRFAGSSISRYFKDIFISEVIGYEKPSIAYFKAVSDRIVGFSAADTLVVGDSLTSDMQGAVNVGWDCCWFNPSKKFNDKHLPITYTIETLTALLTIILL